MTQNQISGMQPQMQMNGMQNPWVNAQPWMAQNWGNPYRSQIPMQPQQAQSMQPTQPVQQMMNPQTPGLNGRFVGGQQEIAVNEVDMNGSVSIFPMNDMSCIFAKQWRTDGTIQTVKYVPMQEEQPSNETQNTTQPVFDYAPFMERFDRIEQLLGSRSGTLMLKKGDAESE